MRNMWSPFSSRYVRVASAGAGTVAVAPLTGAAAAGLGATEADAKAGSVPAAATGLGTRGAPSRRGRRRRIDGGHLAALQPVAAARGEDAARATAAQALV